MDSDESLAPATHQGGGLGWASAGFAPATHQAGGLVWARVKESEEAAEETGEVQVVWKPG